MNIKNSELSQQHTCNTMLEFYHATLMLMDEYLARTDMHSSSVWATEVEIFAFAVSNMLQTPIMVFCKSGHTYKWLQFLPYPCENSSVVCAVHSKEAIYLLNISNHYEPVRRIINSCMNRV